MKPKYINRRRWAGVVPCLLIALISAALPVLAQDTTASLAGPLIDQTSAGAAPTPSVEITPGAGDLTSPTRHLPPVDPLNSSIESTSLSPYANEEPQTVALTGVAPNVGSAIETTFARGISKFRVVAPGVNGAAFSGKSARPVPRQGVLLPENASDSETADMKATWAAGDASEQELVGQEQADAARMRKAALAWQPKAAVSGEIVTPGEIAVSPTQVSPLAVPGVAALPDLSTPWVQQGGHSLAWGLAESTAGPFRDLQSSAFLHPSVLALSSPPSGPTGNRKRRTEGYGPSGASTAEMRLKRDTMSLDQQQKMNRLQRRRNLRPVFHNPILEQMERGGAGRP